VLVGPFVVNVKVLNIDEDLNNTSDILTLGKGGFGSIIAQNDGNEQFVAKRIKFHRKLQLMEIPIHKIDWVLTATYPEVKDAVFEYSFAKVCSLLRVGPKIKIDMGFDLVCSHTSIEFYMERCEQVGYGLSGVTIDTITRRLRYCVAVLHKHQLIHKDIKLNNIVYSHHYKDYVLCDFGISTPVQ
jgi:hypothetical protein